MSSTRFKLNLPAVLSIPAADAEALLSAANGDAALLYLHTLNNGGVLDAAAAAAALGRDAGSMEAAARVLESRGLLHGMAPLPEPEQALPQYQASDIYSYKKNPEFASLLKETESLLGRQLSGPDMNTLLGIWDRLALPADVIMLLLHHCVDEAERRGGPGKKPGFRTIEKQAYAWFNSGITTYERAEEWLRALAERKSAKSQLRSALGLGGREYSPTEEKFVDKWLSLGFGVPALAEAYDRTVVNTGALSWKYMDSIVMSWHGKNLHTPEEIAAEDGPKTRRPQPAAGSDEEYRPTREDFERLKKLQESLKNDH